MVNGKHLESECKAYALREYHKANNARDAVAVKMEGLTPGTAEWFKLGGEFAAHHARAEELVARLGLPRGG